MTRLRQKHWRCHVCQLRQFQGTDFTCSGEEGSKRSSLWGVRGSVTPQSCPSFLSVHFAILTKSAFFLRLVPYCQQLTGAAKLHIFIHCMQTHEKESRSFPALPFHQGRKTFPENPPADFLMGAFDSSRLLDHTPVVGKLVKQVSAIFSWYIGRSALLRKDGGGKVVVD